ncbi:hypothetical protein SDC9_14600 [bioreactor metagenome]|uniref:Uncharacterized protein n=1 Tax=bioreactor metagenome TaxID=1076179 RepID=A0A644TQY1_9ZZZZ
MTYYRILSLLILAAAPLMANWIPEQWGWENSVVEWLQVAVLALGLLLSWKQPSGSFGLFTTPIWLILIGRELSWGRVLFPLGVNAHGPYFPALKQLWYGQAVYPIVAILLLGWIFAIIKYKLYKVPLAMIKNKTFPWINLAITFLGVVTTHFSEHILHLQKVEEIAETVVYVGFIVLALQIKQAVIKPENNKQYQVDR